MSVIRIGVGVIVIKENKVLMGKRKNSIGHGYWSFAGGHLEFGEDPDSCAKREVLEETSLLIDNVRKATFTNDFYEMENKHYITLFMIGDYKAGEPKLMEPEKCEGWSWYDWDDLPRPLFLPIDTLLKEGYDPFLNTLI